MFTFRQAIPRALNDKLIGVSLQPTTMADLIWHAKTFDKNWRMYNKSRTSQTNVQAAQLDSQDDTSLNATGQSNPQFRRLSNEQKAYRRKNNLCMYCGGKGHYQDKCPKVPKGRGARPPPPHTRATETTDAPQDSTADFDPMEVAEVACIYAEPQFTYNIPEDHKGAQDF
jgi:hypothetical protein